MKNLQGLVSFVESATSGSFTAAANRLELTPAAVSKNVMRLEQELQVRLFNRSTRRLQLTAEGEAFLARAGEALRMLDAAVGDVTMRGNDPVGRVRISSSNSFGRRFALPALPRIAERYPRLELEVSLSDYEVDLIADGFDLAIRGGLMTDSNLVARRICPLQSVLVASPEYLRRHGVPRSPDDLHKHRVFGLRFASGQSMSWRFRRASGSGYQEWALQSQLWATDPDAFLELALRGEGICRSGLLHAGQYLKEGRLKLVLHDLYDHGKREMYLCYPHRQLVSQRVRLVVDELMAAFAEVPALQLDVGKLPRAWHGGARSRASD